MDERVPPPQPHASEAPRVELWYRWTPIWWGLYLAVLVTVLLLDPPAGEPGYAVAGLLAVLGTLGFALTRLWRRRPVWTLVGLVAEWSLWAWGCSQHPVWLFLLLGLFPQLFSLARPWVKVLGALALALVSVFVTFGLDSELQSVGGLSVLATLGGLALAFFIRSLVTQANERQRLIDELSSARRALATAERQAGTLEERSRWTLGLHDTVAQSLAGIVLHLDAAEALLDAKTPRLATHLEQAGRAAREALADTRRLLQSLPPLPLEGRSLEQALHEYVERWRAESQVTPHLSVPPGLQVGHADDEALLFGAVREGLTNVRKHARARQVSVELRQVGTEVVLTVADDGVGLQPSPNSERPGVGGGFGLLGLTERTRLRGGRLDVQSTPGQGTTLKLALPRREAP